MEVKKRNLRLYGQILTYWQFNGEKKRKEKDYLSRGQHQHLLD